MDSGNNSGSLQSSSGGSEEYDSRAAAADSISAFLNQPPPPQPQPQQQPPSHHHQMGLTPSSAPPPMFDSLYNFDPNLSRSPLNLDMVWSKNLRSDPNCTDLSWLMSAAPPTLVGGGGGGGGGNGSVGLSFSSIQGPPEVGVLSGSGTGSGPGTATTDQISTVRNPKKRSRASRRAPTTVLTTDTTNFRAMVQEFTGIPAPPFTSSHFPRTRLDLFGTGTASSMRSNSHLDPSPPPPFLLRPFAQKIQHPSMVDAVAINTKNVLESPGLNFQTLLQSPPKYPVLNPANLGTKIQSLEDFGHGGHGNATISNMVSMSRTNDNNNNNNMCHNLGSWGEADQHHKANQMEGNGKVGFSGEQYNKAPENTDARRSEGMVESWICSSD